MADARDSKSRGGNTMSVQVRLPAPISRQGRVAMVNDCIFCKIIAREIPAHIVDENDEVIVIQDIAPKAPIHYLVIPKTHIKDVQSLQEDELNVVASMIAMTQKVAKWIGGSGSYRLIINNGTDAGQSVFHLHMHLVSGKKMVDF
jgi:histidine triad (HIT) family protein